MKKVFVFMFSAVLIAPVFTGCEKPATYSDIPAIGFVSLGTYQNINRQDSLAVITISFTDGDGDVGLTSADTLSPYNKGSIYYNDFIVSFFQKQNGVWVEDTALECSTCIGFSGRIPYLTQTGNDKALKGNISMNEFLPPGLPTDTIHFTVFIYDRALHKSNTITTSDIVITTN